MFTHILCCFSVEQNIYSAVSPSPGECLSVDDDCLYQGEGEGLLDSSGGNINCYRQRRLREQSTSGDGESDSVSSGDVGDAFTSNN